MHPKFYLGLASSKGGNGWKWRSLAQLGGRDLEGQRWLHWIVHEKWPVYCANLMSSFLLVIEIHATKVLPRIYLDLEKNGWKWRFFAWLRVKWRSYGVPMVYNGWLSQALSNDENRIPSFLLVTATMAQSGLVHAYTNDESNGWKWRPFRSCGVKWRSQGVKVWPVTHFHQLYRMIKTASLHSF